MAPRFWGPGFGSDWGRAIKPWPTPRKLSGENPESPGPWIYPPNESLNEVTERISTFIHHRGTWKKPVDTVDCFKPKHPTTSRPPFRWEIKVMGLTTSIENLSRAFFIYPNLSIPPLNLFGCCWDSPIYSGWIQWNHHFLIQTHFNLHFMWSNPLEISISPQRKSEICLKFFSISKISPFFSQFRRVFFRSSSAIPRVFPGFSIRCFGPGGPLGHRHPPWRPLRRWSSACWERRSWDLRREARGLWLDMFMSYKTSIQWYIVVYSNIVI